MKTVKMKCPVPGCKFIGTTQEEWESHFKAAHPYLKEIKIGELKIKLSEA